MHTYNTVESLKMVFTIIMLLPDADIYILKMLTLAIYAYTYNILGHEHDTLFMFVCKHNMRDVALLMLKTPELCIMNNICSNDTVLMTVCRNKMLDIALQMLETPKLCMIDHVGRYGDTALILACKNNMEHVAIKIMKTMNEDLISHANRDSCNALYYAVMKNMTQAINVIEYINHINEVEEAGKR